MHLWIDADACPKAIQEVILKVARRLTLPTTFVANQALSLPSEPHLSFVRVKAGLDVADQHIVAHAVPGDLVVTQDIPLAAELTFRQIMVISNHGKIYTGANMADRLATRNLMQGLRDSGQMTGGPRPYSEKDRQTFINALDKAITYLKKRPSI